MARRKLPRPPFDFIDGGAEDEVTVRANRASFDAVRFVPRVLTDTSTRDLSTIVGGQRLEVPIMLSPVGLLGPIHPDGEKAAAVVAKRHGTIAVVSGHATYSCEEIAEAVPSPGWFNVFPWGDRDRYGQMIERAAAAGYDGLCVTLDLRAAGNREREIASGWTAPPRLTRNMIEYGRHPVWVARLMRHRRCTLRNFDARPPKLRSFVRQASDSTRSTIGSIARNMDWDDLEWIRRRWQGVLAAKGGFSVSDAKRMAEIGVDVLYIGNHGGRILDGMQSSLEQLATLDDAVGTALDLVLDGGVSRGTHIAKALCLGAKACSIGRAWVYGLACGGTEGVDAVMSVLVRELDTTLTQLGAAAVSELDRTFVTRAGSRNGAGG